MSAAGRSPRLVIRILCLDGGGVRGLTSLLILRHFMHRVEDEDENGGSPAGHQRPLRPCDCFHLIIGTGTGGISAIFLGRLGMTIDEAISEYLRMAENVFETSSNPLSRWFQSSKTLFDGEALEAHLAQTIKRFLGDADTPMADSTDPPRCRTAVLATTEVNADAPPHIFRSYNAGEKACRFTLVQVARTTSASTGIFPAISLDEPPISFIDAGNAGYNNPTEIAIAEAKKIWPNQEAFFVLSIGTGAQPIIDATSSRKWIKAKKMCEKMIQNCESVHDRLAARYRRGPISYNRLNVDQGLQEVGVKEWKEAGPNGRLAGITSAYMRKSDAVQKLDACLEAFNQVTDIPEVKGEIPVPAVDAVEVAAAVASSSLPTRHPKPGIFYGREEFVEQAIEVLLSTSGAHLALLGSGGIGKTSIARAILHDQRISDTFNDDRHFIYCEAITSPALLIDSISLALGVPSTSSDRLNALVHFVQSKFKGRRLLIILDNFETLWDVKKMQAQIESDLEVLGSLNSLSFIITMRGSVRPPGIRWTHPLLPPVGTLTAEASRLVYCAICPRVDESLDALLSALDHVPLAVTLMAHLGQAGVRPATLLQRWNTEQTTFLKTRHGSDRLKSVEVSIRLSLESDLMRSNPEAEQLLSVISILPNGVPNGQLPSMVRRVKNINDASEVLLEAALAYYDSSDTLRILSPIRTYMLRHHFPSEEMLIDVETFYFQLSKHGNLNPGDDGYVGGLALLKGVEMNMEAVISLSLTRHPDDQSMDAAIAFSLFLRRSRPREALIEQAVDVARTRLTAYLPECLQSLGYIYHMLHRYDVALRTFTEAKVKFDQIGNQRQAADCLMKIGEVHRFLGEYNKAREVLTEAAALFKATEDRSGAAICLHILGDTDRMQSKYEEARAALTEARAEFKAIGRPRNAAMCLWSLGEIHSKLSEYEEAQSIFTQAKLDFDALGYDQESARCLMCLGGIHRHLGRHDEARDAFTQAKVGFEVTGDRNGSATCTFSLGDLYLDMSMHGQARIAFTEALSEFEAMGDRYNTAWCLLRLGQTDRTPSNFDVARTALNKAEAIFRAIGCEREVGFCLESLGEIDGMLAVPVT